MKISFIVVLFATSYLLADAAMPLLIKRAEYITHPTVEKCDDCCSTQQSTGNVKFTFYGTDYSFYYPCANGLISFNGEVQTFTPRTFPIASQPVVAAFWGDVDLRTCDTSKNEHCTYYKFYDSTSSFVSVLDDTVRQVMGQSSFSATGLIVQTWDEVGYYRKKTDKTNTFQIIIATDQQNTYCCMYYTKLEWTTGDASGGKNGLGGTPAQMGFDAGDKKNFAAHPNSQTASILSLATENDGRHCYRISDAFICPSGYTNDGSNNCVPNGCQYAPSALLKSNMELGTCTNSGVSHDSSCYLECAAGYQPANGRDTLKTTCAAGEYSQISGSCSKIGFNVLDASTASSPTTFSLSESDSTTGTKQRLSINLQVAPMGDVTVELVANDTSEVTVMTPNTLTFTKSNWAVYQEIKFWGANDFDSDGDVSFQLALSVKSTSELDSSMPSSFPAKKYYGNLGNFGSYYGVTFDDEGAQIFPSSGYTSEKNQHFDNKNAAANNQCPGSKLKLPTNDGVFACDSDDVFGITLTKKPVAQTIITLSSSDTTEAESLEQSLTINVNDWNETRYVTVLGKPDDKVDGGVPYEIQMAFSSSCTTSQSTADEQCYNGFSVRPWKGINNDDPTLGITVNDLADPTAVTTTNDDGVTELSYLETDEDGLSSYFTIVMTSSPDFDVKLAVSSSNRNEGAPFPEEVTFTETNWNIPQTVTVTGRNDDESEFGQESPYTITVSVKETKDSNYVDYKWNGVSNYTIACRNKDNEFYLSPEQAAAMTGGIASLLVLIVAIIVAVLIFANIRRKSERERRLHEAQAKETLTAGANETKINFAISAEDEGLDIDDLSAQLLSVNQKLKDEVNRLVKENRQLAQEAGVEASHVEPSDNAAVLVNQIKELKAANNALRDEGSSRTKRNKKKRAKNKATF